MDQPLLWNPSKEELERIKLSPNFTLYELTKTKQNAKNIPGPGEVENLKVLCNKFLEPIRSTFGPLIINSGYRGLDVNKAIGGSSNSAHTYGCAADFIPVANIDHGDIVKWVVYESMLPFDQIIQEETLMAQWIHLGILRPNAEPFPRKQALHYNGKSYSDWPAIG